MAKIALTEDEDTESKQKPAETQAWTFKNPFKHAHEADVQTCNKIKILLFLMHKNINNQPHNLTQGCHILCRGNWNGEKPYIADANSEEVLLARKKQVQ